jgi:hypothetical protein
MTFDDFYWPEAITTTNASVSHIGTHDDVAMTAIQTSLAALQVGSAFAAKVPYIAPIAGLLLQVLTMRDARLTTIFFRLFVF